MMRLEEDINRTSIRGFLSSNEDRDLDEHVRGNFGRLNHKAYRVFGHVTAGPSNCLPDQAGFDMVPALLFCSIKLWH